MTAYYIYRPIKVYIVERDVPFSIAVRIVDCDVKADAAKELCENAPLF
jgi:hypothetical protein